VEERALAGVEAGHDAVVVVGLAGGGVRGGVGGWGIKVGADRGWLGGLGVD
jgi:hypothetical protein